MILDGAKGLLESKKGTLCLIIFFVSSVLCFKGMIPGMYFAAIVSTVTSLYMWTQHKVDLAMQAGAAK